MKCPNCGAEYARTDRVCRKCRLFFEEGHILNLKAPRAKHKKIPPHREHPSLCLRLARLQRWGWVGCVGLGIVPGLGHLALGYRALGAFIFGGLSILFVLSVLAFQSFWGLLLFGLLIAAHSYSIYDLTPAKRALEAPIRIITILVIQALLMIGYWPLLVFLSDIFVRPWRYMLSPMGNPLGYVVITAIVLSLAATWLVRYLVRRGFFPGRKS